MRYRDDQWLAAETLWAHNSGAEVSRLTGINRFALYAHARKHPDRFPPKPYRIRPERLEAIRKDWMRGLKVREIGRRHRLSGGGVSRLASLHGWSSRKRGPSGD